MGQEWYDVTPRSIYSDFQTQSARASPNQLELPFNRPRSCPGVWVKPLWLSEEENTAPGTEGGPTNYVPDTPPDEMIVHRGSHLDVPQPMSHSSHIVRHLEELVEARRRVDTAIMENQGHLIAAFEGETSEPIHPYSQQSPHHQRRAPEFVSDLRDRIPRGSFLPSERWDRSKQKQGTQFSHLDPESRKRDIRFHLVHQILQSNYGNGTIGSVDTSELLSQLSLAEADTQPITVQQGPACEMFRWNSVQTSDGRGWERLGDLHAPDRTAKSSRMTAVLALKASVNM